MLPKPQNVQRVYLTLTALNTLSASLIWGINTLFLLNAGLSNAQAFAANAFFTLGQVIFEVPTGVVADTLGRKTSYLLGLLTLSASTALYLLLWQYRAPFGAWAVASMFLGLGFTFFSGAVEAWLVDALNFAEFKGNLESVFAKSQVVTGASMLTGSIAGGVIAQFTNLGVPYILRAVTLAATFIFAWFVMKDWGFTPKRSEKALKDMKQIFVASLDHGLRNPPVRWVMLAAPFTYGVSFYVFYAMQPYLLNLYGDPQAYSIAGLAAAIVACAQIVGGMAAPFIRKLFARRTTAMFASILAGAFLLAAIGLTNNFWAAIALLVLWGLIFAAITPIRQAYLNGLIPSEQRATVLSFDSLMGSSGGVVIQPALGKAADVWSYSGSYIIGAFVQAVAAHLILLARKTKPASDIIKPG